MMNTVLSRNFRNLRTPCIPYRLPSHSRNASVKTAIDKGLRKSKGVGFKGRNASFEKKQASPWEKPVERDGLVRRTAELRSEINKGSMTREGWRGSAQPLTREGWPGKPGKFAGRGKTDSDVRIRRGTKTLKTDAQLARKKPNPAGLPRFDAYKSDKPAWGRSKFEDESRVRPDSRRDRGSDRPAFPKRDFDGRPERPRPNAKIPTSSFRDNEDKKSSNSDSSKAYERPPRLEYPSLSFGKPKFAKGRPEVESSSKYPDKRRGFQSSESTSGRRRESQYSGRAHERKDRGSEDPYKQRPSYSEDKKFGGRQSASVAADGGDRQPSYKKTYGSEAGAAKSSGPFTMGGDRKDASAKPDEDATKFRITHKAVGMPLSVPYTTPASEFLYGSSVVESALRSTRVPRRQLYKLYIYTGDNRDVLDRDVYMEVLAKANKNRVQIVKMDNNGLRLMDKMSNSRPHNGYVLEASPLPRIPITSLGNVTFQDDKLGLEVVLDHQSREEAAVNGTSAFARIPKDRNGRKPLVLLLDGIKDTGNLGNIIRTALFLGVSAVAISAKNSAPFNPVVLKASAGASENITLFSINNPSSFIQDSKVAGWKIFAAVAPSPNNGTQRPVTSVSTHELRDPLLEDPCILMLGGEGDGLHKNLRSKANVELYIPATGRNHTVDSLNVTVAGGILCHAFLGGQSLKEASRMKDQDREGSADDLF